MKKRSGAVAAALVIAAALAGCSSPTGPGEKDPDSDTEGGKTEVGLVHQVPAPRLA